MSADHELLGLAAKAAGLKVLDFYRVEGVSVEGQRRTWSPLTDDGDALRLAVKLKLDVLTHGAWDSTGTAPAVIVTDGSDKKYEVEAHGDDACAATRLAIVKVAAAIGKALP